MQKLVWDSDTFPPPRDEKWMQVFAFVEKFEALENVTRFYIEIRHDGQLIYTNIVVPDEDLADFDDLYGMTLDRMVHQIDTHLASA